MPAVPAMLQRPPITVDVWRGQVVESRHVVYGAMWGPGDTGEGRLLASWGDAGLVTFLRSTLKPFQVLPHFLDGGDGGGLSTEEIAVACGSHSGGKEHVALVRHLLARSGLGEDALGCGGHAPLDVEEARRVGAGFGAVHNNCSGKHAAMLAWCVARGEDLVRYRETDHPLHERVKGLTAVLSGVPLRELGVAVDGCSIPTFAASLAHAARLYRVLARPGVVRGPPFAASLSTDEEDGIVVGLDAAREAMALHPHLVAGKGRPDTDVGHVTKGRIITKAGAEGLWCGLDADTGVGFAFKALDGGFRAAVPAGLAVLGDRGLLSADEMKELATHVTPTVKNVNGWDVGRLEARLP